MRSFIVGALLLWGTSANAQGIRYDRMHMACGDTLLCHIVVDGMAFDDDLYTSLRQHGKATNIDRMLMLRKHADLIREYFPDAWKGQDCPLGNCREHRAPLPLEIKRMLRERSSKQIDDKGEKDPGS